MDGKRIAFLLKGALIGGEHVIVMEHEFLPETERLFCIRKLGVDGDVIMCYNKLSAYGYTAETDPNVSFGSFCLEILPE